VEIDWEALRSAAIGVMAKAYAPYSKFPVGAAGLVDDGRVVIGCNVENAAYGVVLCAECGVVSALHASGGGRLVALSCVDGDGQPLMPCGRCRQLLWENGGPECLIDAEPGPLAMAELLPHAFGPDDLANYARTSKAEDQFAVPTALAKWRGRGTVFVHPDVAGGRPVWTGYWERSSGAPANAEEAAEAVGILEEAPSFGSTAEAVAWGQQRTARIVVVAEDGSMAWAGEGEPPVEIGRRWQPE
jgi:cytidine deaminase